MPSALGRRVPIETHNRWLKQGYLSIGTDPVDIVYLGITAIDKPLELNEMQQVVAPQV